MRDFMLSAWGLEHNLFVSSPPERDVLERVFTGREEQLQAALGAVVDAPRRLLVKGLFGAGKTVLMQELQRRLESEKRPPVFVMEHLYQSDTDISTVILRGLASELQHEDPYAKALYEAFLGETVARRTSERSEESLKGGVPKFAEATDRDVVEQQTQTELKSLPKDPITAIRKLLTDAQERSKGRRIVMAIDDLDKRDPSTVRQLLTASRDLLHNPMCSYMLTGHPIGVRQRQ